MRHPAVGLSPFVRRGQRDGAAPYWTSTECGLVDAGFSGVAAGGGAGGAAAGSGPFATGAAGGAAGATVAAAAAG